jgi:EmrB/QacA subfamily drug resistance transporter
MTGTTFTARQRMTLVATGLGLFMIYLDATVVNVALPDIQSDFDAGEQGLQWVVAAYSLTMGMFIMSAATLADLQGRRRVFLVGTTVFLVASAACGAAPNLTVLVIARGVQGIGAATVNVASLALVSAAFPDAGQKARAIGIWTGIAAVGLAIGPTVGGVMTEGIGWRSIFYVNVVIGVAAIVAVRAVVAESRDPQPRRFDLPGQLLFIAGVGALTYALIEGPHAGWASPTIVGLLLASVVLVAAFVRVELTSDDPMMDVRVFGDRVYTAAIVSLFALLFAIYGFMLVMTQYLQNVEGYSPEGAGLLMLAQTVPLVVISPVVGSLVTRFGARRPTLLGLACLVVGTVVMIVGLDGSLPIVVAGMVLYGFAAGLCLTPTTNIAMASIPPDRAGMASGILSAQRALGSTAGFAIMGSVLAAVVAATLPTLFEPYIPDEATRDEVVEQVVDDADPRAVVALIGPGTPLPDDVAETPELLAAADDAFVDGIRAALAVGGSLGLVALVIGFRVFPRGRGDERRAEDVEAAVLRVDEAEREAM